MTKEGNIARIGVVRPKVRTFRIEKANSTRG
jgi:hypothetical protein